jgi:hypothetical protein
MIGFKPQGRLGNQLFQYAFAYAQAKKLNTTFFVGENRPPAHVFKLHEYFALRENESKINKKGQFWLKKFYKYLPSFREYFQLGYEDIQERKNVLTSTNAVWDGYFQSEEYFSPYQDEIIDLFQIKSNHKTDFEAKYKEIVDTKKILAIHVRRTDYVEWGSEELGGKNMTLPMSYYKNCLDLITNVEDYHVVVLSDDIEFAKNAFSEYSNFTYSTESEIIDFQIILNADSVILSNSTFAWWASFLNQKKGFKGYAPKYWLGFKVNKENPIGIMTEKFDWIDVY